MNGYCGRTDSMGVECEKPELDRRIADLECKLAEARKAAAWQKITPENLPKKGQIVLTDVIERAAFPATVDWPYMHYGGWFINPPAPEGSKP
jgi:hypothetical protein